MTTYKKFKFAQFSLCLVLLLQTKVSDARPLEPEDVASLLPATILTKNETVAAIVQDPVIQNAVQTAIGNGSLSGLVVKKNVVIIPASAPDQVLSHTEQILVAPMSHLEDIRKNITEAGKAGNEEQEKYESSVVSSDELNAAGDKKEGIERSESVSSSRSKAIISSEEHEDVHKKIDVPTNNAINEIKPVDTLPENIVTEKLKLPQYMEETIPVSIPIVAVLDPSQKAREKIESSIVALLPNEESNDTKDQQNFLEDNRKEIRDSVQGYVDESSMSVNPENWQITVSQPEADYNVPRDVLLTSVIVPLDETSPVVWASVEDVQNPKELEDMDVAEDIIFRPLFRFRQEARQKASYQSSYERRNYDRYNSYRRPYYRSRPRSYDYDY